MNRKNLKAIRRRMWKTPRLYVCPCCSMVFNPQKMNEEDRKEWIISGLCHECQVDVFTKK